LIYIYTYVYISVPDLPPPALKERKTALAEERDKKQRNIYRDGDTLFLSLSLSLSNDDMLNCPTTAVG